MTPEDGSVLTPLKTPWSGVHSHVAGSGEPVVLIHGLSGSSRWWRKNTAALAQCFRVYTIDLIGFGGSRRSGRFILDEAVARLDEWMDEVELERAHFVGHSMGGLIAVKLALEKPERLSRLILVSATVVPFAWGYVGHGTRIARALPRVPLAFLIVLITDSLRAGPRTILRAAREMLAADTHQHLERITVPTLCIWGERDPIVPKELGEQVAAAIPGAELIVIRRAGHVAMWEQPDEFNRVVIEFLGEECPTSGRVAWCRGAGGLRAGALRGGPAATVPDPWLARSDISVCPARP
jgi:pimeloyl-ACP methyl ester carboxylesterase